VTPRELDGKLLIERQRGGGGQSDGSFRQNNIERPH